MKNCILRFIAPRYTQRPHRFTGVLLFITLFSTAISQANVLGDMQTFAPNTDGLDFITVHTGRPLPKGVFAFSNYLNYAHGHLLVYKDLVTQEKYSPYNDQLAEYDLDIAYGVTDKLQVFFATPILLWQKPDADKPIAVNISKGSATYRPGFKYTLSDNASGDSAVIASYETLTVKDSPYVGSNPNPIGNFEYAVTWKNKEFKYQGLNIGYRWRRTSETPATARMFPIGDQILASYAYSAPFTNTSRWIFEVFASAPVNKDPYKKLTDASSVDLLLGLKHRWYKNLNFDWGVTVEPPGLESLAPTFRLWTGIVYYWKPTWNSSEPAASVPVVAKEAPSFPIDERPLTLPLKIIPETAEILEASTLMLRADGGSAPYTFTSLSGPVKVQATGALRALRPGFAKVQVTDAEGTTAQASLRIRPIPKADKEITLKNLHFKFDKSELTKDSEVSLAKQLPTIRKLKINRIIVVGHTDSKGTDEYNWDLSERRALAIKKVLMMELALMDSQVDAIGRGENRPIAPNTSEQGRLINRRVELKIYFKK